MVGIIYANQGATRNKPLTPELEALLQRAAEAAGIDSIRVISGGQSGKRRTGSHRHDHGNAGDIELLRGGRLLDMTNQSDLPILSSFVSQARGLGATGIGAGTDYMGSKRLHVGFGSPAIWGAGGRSANAPQWLKTAANAPIGTTLTSAQTAMAPAAPAPALAPAPSAVPAAPAQGGTNPLAMIAQALGGRTEQQQAAPSSAGEIAPSSIGISGTQDLSAGAAALMASLLADRQKKLGLSLTGMG